MLLTSTYLLAIQQQKKVYPNKLVGLEKWLEIWIICSTCCIDIILMYKQHEEQPKQKNLIYIKRVIFKRQVKYKKKKRKAYISWQINNMLPKCHCKIEVHCLHSKQMNFQILLATPTNQKNSTYTCWKFNARKYKPSFLFTNQCNDKTPIVTLN